QDGLATIRPWRFGPSSPVLPLGSCNRMLPWAVPSAYGKRSEHWTGFVSYTMIAHLLADEGGSDERAGDHHRGCGRCLGDGGRGGQEAQGPQRAEVGNPGPDRRKTAIRRYSKPGVPTA